MEQGVAANEVNQLPPQHEKREDHRNEEHVQPKRRKGNGTAFVRPPDIEEVIQAPTVSVGQSGSSDGAKVVDPCEEMPPDLDVRVDGEQPTDEIRKCLREDPSDQDREAKRRKCSDRINLMMEDVKAKVKSQKASTWTQEW